MKNDDNMIFIPLVFSNFDNVSYFSQSLSSFTTIFLIHSYVFYFFHFLIIVPVVYTLTVLTPLSSIIVRYLYTTLVCESVLFNTNLGIS